MHILLFVLMLQQPLPTRARIVVPQLREVETVTVPGLNKNSPIQTYEMGRDIGGLASALGYLQSDVDNLKKLRADPDRKDIDDLKKTVDKVTVWGTAYLSVFGAVLIIFGSFAKRIWREMVLPRIRNIVMAQIGETRKSPVSTST